MATCSTTSAASGEPAAKAVSAEWLYGKWTFDGEYSKSLYEGGKQEREIAASYERHALICSRWPRTARALRAAAKDYFSQAEQEDERAQARE